MNIYIYVIYIYITEEKCRRGRDCFSFLLPSIIRLCGPLFFFSSRFVSWPRLHVFLLVRGERSLCFSFCFSCLFCLSPVVFRHRGRETKKKEKEKAHTETRRTRTGLILREKKVLSKTIDQQHAQREHGNASFTFNSHHNKLILLRIVKKQRQIFREKSY